MSRVYQELASGAVSPAGRQVSLRNRTIGADSNPGAADDRVLSNRGNADDTFFQLAGGSQLRNVVLSFVLTFIGASPGVH